MPAKKPGKARFRARKEVERLRLRMRERKLRESLAPFISEPNAWSANLRATIERLGNIIVRGKTGATSFRKNASAEQLERPERSAPPFWKSITP